MFPVKCKDLLPLDHIVIKSVAVRGRLGPLTVWVSNDEAHSGNGEYRFRLKPKYWTKIYQKTQPCSRHSYKELVFDNPIRLLPGQVKAIYIHSTLPGDEAIVYDNSYYGMLAKRYEDEKIAILTGRAHVSSEVFGQEPIWGWGNAWRDRREFVGRMEYGTVYKLWNPQMQPKFGNHFQDGARALFLCQRRWESPLSKLPDECIFYILNMCRWDWFQDNASDMKERRRKEKNRIKQAKQEAEAAVAKAKAKTVGLNEVSMKPAAESCCSKRCKSSGMDVDDIMDTEDAQNEDGARDEDVDDNSDDEDEEEEEDEDDEDEDEDEDWQGNDEDQEEEADSEVSSDDEDQYHRANHHEFTYRDVESDNSDDENDEGTEVATSGRSWFRRQFARIQVLRALSSMEDSAIAHVQF